MNSMKLLQKLLFRGVVFSFLIPLYLNLLVSSAKAYYTNMPASVVVGQSDFSSNSAGTSQTQLNGSDTALFVDPRGRLIVADDNNSRVLIWNQIPTANNTPADLVLGQPDFTSFAQNTGGRSASSMNKPKQVFSDGNRLFVADRLNGRVLIWNTFPTQNGQAADLVIGQSDFATTVQICSQSNFDNRTPGVWVYNNKLIVVERNQSRVLIWNSIPTTNYAPADVVLGQANFSTCGAGTISGSSFSLPQGVLVDSRGRLFISDTGRNRVLMWNSIPTENNKVADLVIGQTDFVTNTSGTTTNKFGTNTSQLFSTGERIFLSDSANHRVLIFNSVPSGNGTSADIVLGQSNFTSSSVNGGGNVSSSGFSGPQGIFEYDKQLLIYDTNNKRVLIFNNILSTPNLSVNTPPENVGDHKKKVVGNVVLGERPNYSMQNVQVSVNGGGFGNVEHVEARDEGSGATKYDFSHEFEPWSNNGTKETWEERGYTLKVKASSYNAEDNYFYYFEPFWLNSVTESSVPILSFQVNKYQWQNIKDNLDSFEVDVKKEGETAWTKYAEKISFTDDIYNKDTGAVTLTARPKSGLDLSVGNYQIKVLARDRWDHRIETNSLSTSLSSSGSYYNPMNLALTTSWFPLQVNSISGVTKNILSSFTPLGIQSSYTSTTTKPTFTGVAFTGSTVAMNVTDIKSKETNLFTTKAINSSWSLTPTIYSNTVINLSVYDDAGHYNLLSPLTVIMKPL